MVGHAFGWIFPSVLIGTGVVVAVGREEEFPFGIAKTFDSLARIEDAKVTRERVAIIASGDPLVLFKPKSPIGVFAGHENGGSILDCHTEDFGLVVGGESEDITDGFDREVAW